MPASTTVPVAMSHRLHMRRQSAGCHEPCVCGFVAGEPIHPQPCCDAICTIVIRLWVCVYGKIGTGPDVADFHGKRRHPHRSHTALPHPATPLPHSATPCHTLATPSIHNHFADPVLQCLGWREDEDEEDEDEDEEDEDEDKEEDTEQACPGNGCYAEV